MAAGIDAKATFLLGFSAIGVQILLSQDRAAPWSTIAFVLFAIAIVAGGGSIMLREYKIVPNPREINEYYASQVALTTSAPNLRENVLAKLVGTKQVAIVANRDRDKSKVRFWWATVVAFVLAIAMSVIAVTEAPDETRPGHGGAHTHAP
jgi:hypothetical protein